MSKEGLSPAGPFNQDTLQELIERVKLHYPPEDHPKIEHDFSVARLENVQRLALIENLLEKSEPSMYQEIVDVVGQADIIDIEDMIDKGIKRQKLSGVKPGDINLNNLISLHNLHEAVDYRSRMEHDRQDLIKAVVEGRIKTGSLKEEDRENWIEEAIADKETFTADELREDLKILRRIDPTIGEQNQTNF